MIRSILKQIYLTQTMPSIRKAKNSDYGWMASKSIHYFNTHEPMSKKWLENFLKKCKCYVLDDESGYISYVHEPEGMLINGWYAEGNGLSLWRFLEKLAEKNKIKLIGFLHKTEDKFYRFLKKRGYKIEDFNKRMYFVERVN